MELRTAHQRGEHVGSPRDDCPVCTFRAVPELRISANEFFHAMLETPVGEQAEWNRETARHKLGAHLAESYPQCIMCLAESEEE